MATPGEDERRWEEKDNKKELESQRAKIIRAVAARCNYLAQDGPDIMYSTKELCRKMAKPDVGSWRKAKRIARYLRQVPRTVLRYDWQSDEADLEGYSDSDWAGCRVTGKSTSGGVVMIGEHYVKGWSRTQNCVTLSSERQNLWPCARSRQKPLAYLIWRRIGEK